MTAAGWPRWLEAARCPDGLFAQAWGKTTDDFRAAVKTAIALAFAHFGQRGGDTATARGNNASGFWEKAQSGPAPWALAVFDAAYAAPARLLAACVLPPLCGVPLAGACCLGGAPGAPLLTALELCGVEDVFCLEPAQFARQAALLPPGGALALLGGAAQCAVRGWREGPPPALYVADGERFNLPLLALAQGMPVDELLTPKERPDAVYGVEESPLAPLALGPGLEAFWLFENLGPAFFRSRRLAFGLEQNAPDDF